MSHTGLYIVLEGILGCGKGTQIELLKKQLIKKYPDREIVFTREPGGTPLAEELRSILKHEKLTPFREAVLFAEARESNLEGVVKPALRRGAIVISDRCFLSNIAHQGIGRELGDKYVWLLNERLVRDAYPDTAVIFDGDLNTCLSRSSKDNPDKFDQEDKDFWTRTMDAYRNMPAIVKKFGCPTKFVFIKDRQGIRTIEDINGELNEIIDHKIDVWDVRSKEGVNRSSKER